MESLVLPVRSDFSFTDTTEIEEGKICISPMSTEYREDFKIFLSTPVIRNNNQQRDENLVTTAKEFDQEFVDIGCAKKTDTLKEKMVSLQSESKDVKKSTMECVNDSDKIDTKESVKSTFGGTFTVIRGKKYEINEIENEYFVKGKTKRKLMDNRTELMNDNKKKERREHLPLSEFEFLNTSLFPRRMKSTFETDNDAYFKYEIIEAELEETENMTKPYVKEEDIEGRQNKKQHYLRADRHRKKTKAHKQVKSKYCRSLKNNAGRKHLFIHHRVYKLMELEVQRSSYLPSATKAKLDLKRDEIRTLKKKPFAPSSVYNTPRYVAPVAPPQCLAYTLTNHNARSADFDNAVVNLLISLQHRDLTPEDYDLLLRLDEKVAPKTVAEDVLETFKTDTVDDAHTADVCPVCMECYELGQKRKYLPCNHVFHSNCIDMWLKNSSMNCPVDNLPIDVKNR